ncbi:MAG: ribonuclease Y [Candidatus Dojkabacteria bacterium]|jgi:ribonuclease Y|nr:ribonuclease Y [Candidatus Dojkabacteria bacterium]MDD4561294.1 ribonuclease Y [Candidatus Dojkabacteria bacterium]
METVLFVLLTAIVSTVTVVLVLKYAFHWVKVDNIPEKDIEEAAKKLMKEKFESAEQEIGEMKEKEENRIKQMRRESTEHEGLLIEREKKLNRRSKILDEKTEDIEQKESSLKEGLKRLETNRAQLKKELEKISGLSREEAKERLMKEVDKDLVEYEAKKIRQAQKNIEVIAEEEAQKILVESMQRVATDYVAETTTKVIKVEDDKVKGRVIGREGRNIRAFEQLTGVDIIVDESPDSIGLSSFDPLRREIAYVAMTKLIADGRIHPGSIEDAVKRAKNEISKEIKKNGQILADEANWPDIDLGLMKLVGKMKYRSSYGQSLMQHTIEVIRLAEVLASEIGADVQLAKRAALLHDVGKVLSHKVDSPHHHISGQVARKYGLDEKLINAIEAHHLDIDPQTPEAVVIYLADAISGSRPGARKDSYEQYIQRIEGIEKAAKEVGKDKIEEVYAIKAGREVRVIVKPLLVSDDDAKVMAKDIAEEIEKNQSYPGNVEVTVIRETRAIDVAK